MPIQIKHDATAPTAAVELMITRSLPDYDLEEVEARVPREVDGILVRQGFRDLLDDAQGILDHALTGGGLEIAQLTGAICSDGDVFRPGIWLVLRESGAAAGQAMSAAARERVAAVAEEMRTRLSLS
jgi:hypothetical protein